VASTTMSKPWGLDLRRASRSSFAFVSEMAMKESARLRRLARSSFGPGFEAIVSYPGHQ